jgi:hypothetical protein
MFIYRCTFIILHWLLNNLHMLTITHHSFFNSLWLLKHFLGYEDIERLLSIFFIFPVCFIILTMSFLTFFIQTIFKHDLKYCPTFNKLKTLKLDVWVEPLLCILKYAPLLEKLTIQLDKV